MRTLAIGALAVACASSGCKQERPAPTPVAQAALDSGRTALTKEQVDRFATYQARLVELYDEVLKQSAAPGKALDAGAAEPMRASLQLFERKAKAEEGARAAAGLSEEDVRAISPVVAEVIEERRNAKDQDTESAIKQYEAMRAKLPEGERSSVDDGLADLKADRDRRLSNVDQRQKFGDAAVEAVLTREQDLARLRVEWVKRIAALSK